MGVRGRCKRLDYRLPRSLAHIQVINNRSGKKLRPVDICYLRGTRKRAMNELFRLLSRDEPLAAGVGTAPPPIFNPATTIITHCQQVTFVT